MSAHLLRLVRGGASDALLQQAEKKRANHSVREREQNIDPFCREYFRAVVVAAFNLLLHEEPSIRNDARNPAPVQLISPVVGVLANH